MIFSIVIVYFLLSHSQSCPIRHLYKQSIFHHLSLLLHSYSTSILTSSPNSNSIAIIPFVPSINFFIHRKDTTLSPLFASFLALFPSPAKSIHHSFRQSSPFTASHPLHPFHSLFFSLLCAASMPLGQFKFPDQIFSDLNLLSPINHSIPSPFPWVFLGLIIFLFVPGVTVRIPPPYSLRFSKRWMRGQGVLLLV